MNAPFARQSVAHTYSRHCNCDECFEAWLAMPEPTAKEREASARRFMAALAPSSGGELLTDRPVSFPDLADDAVAGLATDLLAQLGIQPPRILTDRGVR